MFKLPLLQPQLTGSNGVEGRRLSYSSYNGFSTFNGSRPLREDMDSAPAGLGTIEVKSWEAQAKDITSDLAPSEKYKSLVLHAEVKLAEALERCNRVQPTIFTSPGVEKPNRLKTAVCCQLLGEFSELCGPFSRVLKSIRDELLKSIYSSYYISERGLLVFDQLPWFSVADRLEREKAVMVEEREKFQKQLAEQQDCLLRIEEQLSTFQRAMTSAQMETASMKGKMDSLVVMHDAAKLEAKTGREELKRARKEWLKMKDELDAEREAHKQLKAAHEASYLESKQLQAETERLQAALAEAQHEIEQRVPVEAIQGMKDQLQGSSQQLEAAKAQAAELLAQLNALKEQTGSLTPRPLCPQLKAHGIPDKEGGRTQDVVSQAADKLDRFFSANADLTTRLDECLQQRDSLSVRCALLEAVLLPEPLPASVQLSVTTDASKYFITESSAGESSSSLAAEGLGLGQAVPRCLRWHAGDMVKLEAWSTSLEATEKLVAAIWEAKRSFDQSNTRQHPLSFIYTYFAALAPNASSEHPEVAKQAYSLFHACSSHAASSVAVQLFSAVLTGHISEQAWADQQAMMQGLVQTFSSLPRAAAEASGAEGDVSVSVRDAQEAMQHFFPQRGQLQIHQLKQALSATCQGDVISLSALEAAMQPAAQEASSSSGGASAADARDFVELLAAQHLEALESYGEQVAGGLEAALRSDAADSSDSVTLHNVATALEALMSREEALGCIGLVMNLVGLDKGLDMSRAMARPVQVPNLLRLLRAFCLMRPRDSYDIAGACAWAKAKVQG